MGRHEILHATDMGDRTVSLDDLIARIGPAFVKYERGQDRTGKDRTVHLITFDTSILRNTEAHGMGYRAGFVVHITDAEQEAQQQALYLIRHVDRQYLPNTLRLAEADNNNKHTR